MRVYYIYLVGYSIVLFENDNKIRDGEWMWLGKLICWGVIHLRRPLKNIITSPPPPLLVRHLKSKDGDVTFLFHPSPSLLEKWKYEFGYWIKRAGKPPFLIVCYNFCLKENEEKTGYFLNGMCQMDWSVTGKDIRIHTIFYIFTYFIFTNCFDKYLIWWIVWDRNKAIFFSLYLLIRGRLVTSKPRPSPIW